MTVNATTLAALLKTLYVGQRTEVLSYDKSARPFFSMLKKRTDFSGSTMPLPILYDDVAGGTATFSTAQTNIASLKAEAFDIDVVAMHTPARITTDALLRARDDKGTFLKMIKGEMDSAIRRQSNTIEASLFRSGSGAIGTSSTAAAATTELTLSSYNDIVNFYPNQVLVAAEDEDSALRSGSLTVEGVNRDTGVITMTGNLSDGIAALASGDKLFQQGNYVAAGDRLLVRGLDAWLPSTAPSGGDSFFGVDRSVDPTRLGGIRYSGSGSSIEDSIVGAANRLGLEGSAKPDVCLLTFDSFRDLVGELGSKVQRDAGGMAKAGYNAVEIHGPRGPISCIPSTFCPGDVAYLLTSNTWEMISMLEPVHLFNFDGLKMERVSDADALEIRIQSRIQLGCYNPGANARIDLSS